MTVSFPDATGHATHGEPLRLRVDGVRTSGPKRHGLLGSWHRCTDIQARQHRQLTPTVYVVALWAAIGKVVRRAVHASAGTGCGKPGPTQVDGHIMDVT